MNSTCMHADTAVQPACETTEAAVAAAVAAAVVAARAECHTGLCESPYIFVLMLVMLATAMAMIVTTVHLGIRTVYWVRYRLLHRGDIRCTRAGGLLYLALALEELDRGRAADDGYYILDGVSTELAVRVAERAADIVHADGGSAIELLVRIYRSFALGASTLLRDQAAGTITLSEHVGCGQVIDGVEGTFNIHSGTANNGVRRWDENVRRGVAVPCTLTIDRGRCVDAGACVLAIPVDAVADENGDPVYAPLPEAMVDAVAGMRTVNRVRDDRVRAAQYAQHAALIRRRIERRAEPP